MKKYEQLATEIIQNVGGEGNVISLEHCVTRLRFKLKDEQKADTEALKELDGVVTVIKSAGQYQVVIGNAVGDVYDTVLEVSDISGAVGLAADDDGKKMNILEEQPRLPKNEIKPLLECIPILCFLIFVKHLMFLSWLIHKPI